jgi:hypothetical protein
MRKHKVESDEIRRIDLICRKEYGAYEDRFSQAIKDANPTVDFLTLEAGTVLNIPTLYEIRKGIL